MSILERFAKLQDDYEQLCRLIIRPARSPYPLSQLGPEEFKLEGTKVKRIDFELTNSRGYVFFCSHFVPLGLNTHPCVVYTHGNSSNRTEGMEYLGKLIR